MSDTEPHSVSFDCTDEEGLYLLQGLANLLMQATEWAENMPPGEDHDAVMGEAKQIRALLERLNAYPHIQGALERLRVENEAEHKQLEQENPEQAKVITDYLERIMRAQ